MIYFLAPRGEGMTPIRLYLDSPMARDLRVPVRRISYEALAHRVTPERQLWWRVLQRSYRLRWLVRQTWSPLRKGAIRERSGRLLLAYQRLVARTLRPGAYIFAAVDQLSPRDAEVAAVAWRLLAARGPGVRLLNHPTRSLRRYELLRRLHDEGINRFNVYRVTEGCWPERYPVFIRQENVHGGWRTPLLQTREELGRAIDALDAEGRSREDALITEFCDTAGADGRYRRYAAFVVGDHVFPKDLLGGPDWVQRGQEIQDGAFQREEREYVVGNPHADALRRIARVARIDYGRIDYGLLDGRIQVWEINTNPGITSTRIHARGPGDPAHQAIAREMAAALAAIDVPRHR